jgi:hypothetical protein
MFGTNVESLKYRVRRGISRLTLEWVSFIYA